MAQFDVVRTSNKATSGSAARAAIAERQLRRATPARAHLWGLTLRMPRLSRSWPGGFGLSAAELQAMMCGPDKKNGAHANARRQAVKSL